MTFFCWNVYIPYRFITKESRQMAALRDQDKGDRLLGLRGTVSKVFERLKEAFV